MPKPTCLCTKAEPQQLTQLGHLLPPPCAIHLSVLPWALELQPGSLQRLPPPCVTHLSVLP